VDLASASIAQQIPLRIARGTWEIKAWQVLPDKAGGTVWLYTNNNKLSAKHRDWTLWRIAYGSAAKARPKDGALPVQIERMTDDRVVTGAAVLTYPDFTLAFWNNGIGIKNAEPLRCFGYWRDVGASNWQAHDIASVVTHLPRYPAGVTRHMGRLLESPSGPSLPERGVDFAGRALMVHALRESGRHPTGYVFGEIRTDRTDLAALLSEHRSAVHG
jgi:hypothetical protein